MQREDIRESVCQKQGCDWRLDDCKNNQQPIPPNPWVYFMCRRCWSSVATQQEP